MTLGRRWSIAAHVGSYGRRFPLQRGKGWLIRRVLLPILPPDPAVFVARLPGGGRVHLRPRETLGFATLLYGGFETAETACAIELAAPGTTAFDVGANIGIYAVALGRAIGPDGRVVAVEPDPANASRLWDDLALNAVDNVCLVEAVAGERYELVELHIADGPAYNPVMAIEGEHVAVATREGRAVPLDRVWDELGRPVVSFVRVDVQGVEAPFLRRRTRHGRVAASGAPSRSRRRSAAGGAAVGAGAVRLSPNGATRVPAVEPPVHVVRAAVSPHRAPPVPPRVGR